MEYLKIFTGLTTGLTIVLGIFEISEKIKDKKLVRNDGFWRCKISNSNTANPLTNVAICIENNHNTNSKKGYFFNSADFDCITRVTEKFSVNRIFSGLFILEKNPLNDEIKNHIPFGIAICLRNRLYLLNFNKKKCSLPRFSQFIYQSNLSFFFF